MPAVPWRSIATVQAKQHRNTAVAATTRRVSATSGSGPSPANAAGAEDRESAAAKPKNTANGPRCQMNSRRAPDSHGIAPPGAARICSAASAASAAKPAAQAATGPKPIRTGRNPARRVAWRDASAITHNTASGTAGVENAGR